MTQYARPNSDLYVAQYTYSGQRWAWWASTYTDDLYTKIDEATADDSDYAWYRSDGSDAGQDWYRASLSEIDEPSDLSTVSIRVRVQNSVNCTVRLYDGTTLIKSFSTGTNGSVTNIDTALSSTEAGNISDWSDLELRFGCYDQTAYATCYIYQAYLEAGDGAATTTTTFTVSASADDGRAMKSTSSASFPTSGWNTPTTSGGNVLIGMQLDYDNWPNYIDHFIGYFRFQNVTVAQGATISSAYLKPYQSSSNSRTVSVKGFDKDNVSAPTAGSDLAASNFTTAGITNFVTGSGTGQKTSPDIKDIVQEIVDRSGWSSGNSMMFAVWLDLSSASSTTCSLRSYDYSSGSEAAELVIEYEVSGETVTPDAAVAVATAQNPTIESGITITPDPAVAVATAQNPTIESGVEFTPDAAVSVATASSPNVTVAVAGFIVSPNAAVTIATGTNPTVSVITAEVLIQPEPAIAIATATLNPIDPPGIISLTSATISVPSINSASLSKPQITKAQIEG